LTKRTLIRAVLVAGFLLIAIPSFVSKSGGRPVYPAAGDPQELELKDLLWWLPADTESVVAAQGPFTIRVLEDEQEHDREWSTREPSDDEIAREFQQLPLEVFCEMELETPLRRSVVRFAMQGSRYFRQPAPGMDVTDFEGCSIVVFEKDLRGPGNSFWAAREKKAARTLNLAGTKVLVFEQKAETIGYFLAVPQPNVLLAANNLKYLQGILERIGQKKDPRALPDHLPEWRYLDAAAKYWGLRHYDRTQAKHDPTSPIGKNRTFNEGDSKAIGVLFALDPKDQRRAVITSFSGDEAKIREEAKAATKIVEPQEGVKFEEQLHSPEPGVLEHIYTLDRATTVDYVGLMIVMELGRGIYF
jgi:hypothetical protein